MTWSGLCAITWALQELIATVGLGGKLVTPQEMRDLYKREHEELATAAVFFSASNYLAGVTVPPDAVTQFYSNRLATYRIPDRVQVSYVKFDLTNFTAEASAGAGQDDQSGPADRRGVPARRDQFPARMEGAVPGGGRRKMREARRKQLELQSARKKAVEFATPLFDMEPMRADNLEKLAKEKGLAVRITAPFDRETGPRSWRWDWISRKRRLRGRRKTRSPGRSWDGRRVCHRLEQEDPERDSAAGQDPRPGGEGLPVEPGAEPGAPGGHGLLPDADQRAGAGQDARGHLRRRQAPVGRSAAVFAQHPGAAASGGASAPEPVQANRFHHAAREGQPLPDDDRGRRRLFM